MTTNTVSTRPRVSAPVLCNRLRAYYYRGNSLTHNAGVGSSSLPPAIAGQQLSVTPATRATIGATIR